jgi:hypothetical protein
LEAAHELPALAGADPPEERHAPNLRPRVRAAVVHEELLDEIAEDAHVLEGARQGAQEARAQIADRSVCAGRPGNAPPRPRKSRLAAMLGAEEAALREEVAAATLAYERPGGAATYARVKAACKAVYAFEEARDKAAAAIINVRTAMGRMRNP